MDKETHFTESDRKLLTVLEERQKELAHIVNRINDKLEADTYAKKIDLINLSKIVETQKNTMGNIKGALWAISLLGGVLISLLIYIYNADKSAVSEKILKNQDRIEFLLSR